MTDAYVHFLNVTVTGFAPGTVIGWSVMSVPAGMVSKLMAIGAEPVAALKPELAASAPKYPLTDAWALGAAATGVASNRAIGGSVVVSRSVTATWTASQRWIFRKACAVIYDSSA